MLRTIQALYSFQIQALFSCIPRRERLQLDFHAHDLRKGDPGKKCLHQSQTEMETYKDFSLKPDLCLIKFLKDLVHIYIYFFSSFFFCVSEHLA